MQVALLLPLLAPCCQVIYGGREKKGEAKEITSRSLLVWAVESSSGGKTHRENRPSRSGIRPTDLPTLHIPPPPLVPCVCAVVAISVTVTHMHSCADQRRIRGGGIKGLQQRRIQVFLHFT